MTDRATNQPQIAASVLDLVGHTPLVRLGRLAASEGIVCEFVAKVETTNPGGSVKDRPAIEMLDAAEREGLLRPGGTIVEPTSGNTGAGLAIVAAQRGYRCIFVMADKQSSEKAQLLRAYGAEVIVCPTAVAPEDPRSYYATADRLTRETPNSFRPDQYSNPNNPIAHIKTTGPELWEQTAGRITHFVAGIGTGGTITGVGKSLKERNPNVQIVGGDPEGSVYSGGSGRPYLVEGIGEDFWPTTYDPSIVDRVVEVSDADSFLMARRVTREEGLLIGGSGGTAVCAAIEVARELPAEAMVVVLIPDSGRNYLSKIFDDRWMIDHGFISVDGPTTRDVVEARASTLPALVRIHPDEPARAAIDMMRRLDVSQLVVAAPEPPLQPKEIEGSVRELELMNRVFHEPSVLDRRVGDVMTPPLPTVGIGEAVSEVVAMLEGCPAVVVLDGGRPCAVLSRSDVLKFVNEGAP
ncbi:MAG TPA: cystathionine beta-synthase [Acidimicrobiia bacterium]